MAEVDEEAGRTPTPTRSADGSCTEGQLSGDELSFVVGSLDFRCFYDEHRDRLATALALTLRNTPMGAEAADEAMARAYADWSRVAVMANPAGWVYRVGMNWASSRLRRRRREELGVDTKDVARQDHHVDVDLERALSQLSVDHRAVVVARHLLGFSTAETAAALDVSEGTVKSRLSRALNQLRADLEGTHG